MSLRLDLRNLTLGQQADIVSYLAVLKAGPAALNFQGIWWNSLESGWGINFAHQGDTIFASWFTYDLAGRGLWLVMTAPKTGTNTYSGNLFETKGPPFNALTFDPDVVVVSPAGTGTLTFTDANNGALDYTINRIHGLPVTPIQQSKSITRQVFGPLPTCTFGAQPNLALATNYQDLWWKSPAASESGWGINFNHEGDTIFATWFTYDVDGTSMWLVVSASKTGTGVYSGDLFRTTGPAFDVVPFVSSNVTATNVGTATFTFTDGNTATFRYTTNGKGGLAAGVDQTKAITRQVFTAPGTACQ